MVGVVVLSFYDILLLTIVWEILLVFSIRSRVALLGIFDLVGWRKGIWKGPEDRLLSQGRFSLGLKVCIIFICTIIITRFTRYDLR